MTITKPVRDMGRGTMILLDFAHINSTGWFTIVTNGIHLKQPSTFLPIDADTFYFVSAQAAAVVSCVRNASERIIGGKWATTVGRKHFML